MAILVALGLIPVETTDLNTGGTPRTVQASPRPGSGWEQEQEQVPAVTIDVEPELHGAAEAVAACESGHRHPDGTAARGTHRWKVENPSPTSSASGAFQFIDGTWNWVWQDLIKERAPGERAKEATPAQQLRAFEALWDSGRGAHHWDASRSCWQRMLQG